MSTKQPALNAAESPFVFELEMLSLVRGDPTLRASFPRYLSCTESREGMNIFACRGDIQICFCVPFLLGSLGSA